jgi:Fic family protein
MDRIDTRLGYRKVPIVLLGKPNTKLAAPELVHQEMDALIRWYNKSKDTIYPLELALKFHAKFEKIHPFSDGNGRVGRFLLNYILMRKGYFPIIIRKTTRNNYIKALEAADRNRMIVLMRYGLKHYKETFNKFYEVYYKYASSKIGSG